MESLNLRKFENVKAKTTKEILDEIQKKIERLEMNQRYTLSEQEKVHIKTLVLEDLMVSVLNNQQEMQKNIDVLVERWGK